MKDSRQWTVAARHDIALADALLSRIESGEDAAGARHAAQEVLAALDSSARAVRMALAALPREGNGEEQAS